MIYWAIEFRRKDPRVKGRIVGNIMNFPSPQSRAAWCRKAPKGYMRIKLSEDSLEVFWALKSKPRAWMFSTKARLQRGCHGFPFRTDI